MTDGTASDGAAGGPAGAAPLAEAESLVKEMEDLEDYYFGADKAKRMAELGAAAEASVERALASPEGARQQELRPHALLLRGRAASLLPGKERTAEELLSKAIKLDPTLLRAWNALGEVYWNLRDSAQAKQCFEQALELCGPNAVSLRNLSMALRALEGDTAARGANFASALAKAKEAVALDPRDALSWETLGNAYVGDFFVNARSPDEISRALIAYEKAEAAYERLGKRNPTLDFNRGMAARYVEDYQLALASFGRAAGIGAVRAAEEGRKCLDLVRRLAGLVERKHDLKAKRLKELAGELAAEREGCRGLAELSAGAREEAPLAAVVISVVDRGDEVPVILTCCDAAGEFFALSVYNADMRRLAEAVTPMRSVIRVQRPRLRQVAVESPGGQRWGYPCVVVAHPALVALAAGGTLAAAAVQSTVYSTGADRAPADAARPAQAAAAPGAAPGGQRPEELLAQQQSALCRAAKEAAAAGEGKAAVIRALVPALRSLVAAELGVAAAGRLGRVEAMFERMARQEVHTEEDEERGRRYAPGFVEGLSPSVPFHDERALPWCQELKQHWREIRDELHRHLEEAGVWVPGAYAASNTAYAPEWKISGVLTADRWSERWAATRAIVRRLPGVLPFEVFFARMPPHTKIAAHSDNLNYVLTSHLALELEAGMCSIVVGSAEREWEEGEMLVFDTTYMHSAYNDSGRNRYVLVLRFWHPGLTAEERRAIHLSHTLLAGTPDPDKMSGGAGRSTMSMTDG